jgi:hypothetical protein
MRFLANVLNHLHVYVEAFRKCKELLNVSLIELFYMVNGFAKGKALGFAYGSFKEWIYCPLSRAMGQ